MWMVLEVNNGGRESKMSRRVIKRDCVEGEAYVFLRDMNEY